MRMGDKEGLAVHVATAPNPETPLLVTIVVLPGLPTRLPDGAIALTTDVLPARSNGPGSSDGEPTWEDAAWY